MWELSSRWDCEGGDGDGGRGTGRWERSVFKMMVSVTVGGGLSILKRFSFILFGMLRVSYSFCVCE